jgi:hypothetical protein
MNQIVKRSLYTFVLILLLLCGCSQDELTSSWRYDDIQIDGNPQEWQSASYYHLDEPSVGMALCNDQQFLYLRLTTHDSQLQQQLSSGGLQLWIDPQGEQNKTLGIKIASERSGRQGPPSGGGPMGSMENSRPQGDMDSADDSGTEQAQRSRPGMSEPPKGEAKGRPQEQREPSFEFSVDSEVVGSFVAKNNRFDLTLAQGQQQGGLIYELKIPLSGELYQGKLEPDMTITIGLETSEGEGPGGQMQGGQSGGGQSGGGQSGGGGKQGGGKSGGGKPGGGQQEPLDFWFTARLASPEA